MNTFIICLFTLICLISNVSSQNQNEFYFIKAYQNGLKRHNYYRRKHHVPELILDLSISLYSQNYAKTLTASGGQLKSSGNRNYGENLYNFCTTGDINLEDVITMATDNWYEQSSNYHYNNPQFSYNTGSFTQIVWRSSTRVGFGFAFAKMQNSFTKCVYVVANYAPPGNIIGSFKENVLIP